MPERHGLERFQRPTLAVGVAALAICGIGGFFAPAQFFDDVTQPLPILPPLTSAGEAFLTGIEEALEHLPPHDRETVERILGLMTHVLRKAG